MVCGWNYIYIYKYAYTIDSVSQKKKKKKKKKIKQYGNFSASHKIYRAFILADYKGNSQSTQIVSLQNFYYYTYEKKKKRKFF